MPPLTAPSGLITTPITLPGSNDDYTIKVSFKFAASVTAIPFTILAYYGATVADTRNSVSIGLTGADKIAAIHYFDDHIITTNLSGLLDGQFHTVYSILKDVNGTRTSYIYMDGTLLGSTTLLGPTNLTERYKMWVSNGFGASNTNYNFPFGEIKDLYVYNSTIYPGSTAPQNWVQLGQDIDGEAQHDDCGFSVSINSDGTRVAIGAPGNDGNGSVSGNVRVYKV